MVQFGVYLESFRNPAWAAHYMAYGQLKELLYELKKAHDAAASSFFLSHSLSFFLLSLY